LYARAENERNDVDRGRGGRTRLTIDEARQGSEANVPADIDRLVNGKYVFYQEVVLTSRSSG
jgi:hypothetical protein